MTADTVSECMVTRESAHAIALETARDLLPPKYLAVSRETPEPFVVLELTAGPEGQKVTFQRQVTRQVPALDFKLLCSAAWAALWSLHLSSGYRRG